MDTSETFLGIKRKIREALGKGSREMRVDIFLGVLKKHDRLKEPAVKICGRRGGKIDLSTQPPR